MPAMTGKKKTGAGGSGPRHREITVAMATEKGGAYRKNRPKKSKVPREMPSAAREGKEEKKWSILSGTARGVKEQT